MWFMSFYSFILHYFQYFLNIIYIINIILILLTASFFKFLQHVFFFPFTEKYGIKKSRIQQPGEFTLCFFAEYLRAH